MRIFPICLISFWGVSCSEDLNRRVKANSSNAQVKTETEFRIYLPDRAQLETEVADVREKLNSVYLSLQPEGDECNITTGIEEVLPYVDEQLITYQLNVNCDYRMDFLLGNQEADLSLAGEVTYDDVIQPLMVDRCVSCHEEYSTYEGIAGMEENILVQIENGFMPPAPEEALTDFEVASFLGWKAGGYLEANPSPIPEDSPLNQLSAVYYRNNYNSYVYSFRLKIQTFLIYEDSLWLQDDGISLGLGTVEIPVDKPPKEEE